MKAGTELCRAQAHLCSLVDGWICLIIWIAGCSIPLDILEISNQVILFYSTPEKVVWGAKLDKIMYLRHSNKLYYQPESIVGFLITIKDK
jgi:hypothetical protein